MKKLSVPLLIACFALACAVSTGAQQEKNTAPANHQLVRLLQSKGILSAEEAAMVNEASTQSQTEIRLAKLLLSKGLIDQNEFDATVGVAAQGSSVRLASSEGNSDRAIPAVLRLPSTNSTGNVPQATAAKPAEAAVIIPAVSPLRVLPITPPKKDGLLPDIKLGAGARLRPYGFLKASAVHQTVQNGGAIFGSNDFSFGPLMLADTGPDNDSNFHLKARSSRVGVDFEWPDLSKNLTVTGKLEFDFEGNFTNVNNRNISSARSSQPSIRLAFARLDTKIHDRPVFFQFGQDWSLFTSSTLVDMFETTFFGAGLGNLYERMPMFRTGIQFGSGKLKVQPEFALALPSFGEASLSVDQRTRFGGRVGSESGRPEYQTRLVFEYPVFQAQGVAPAQLIFSYDNARRAETIDGATIRFSLPGNVASFFPNGVRLESSRNAWDAEFQLPTPWATLVGKYYRGADLRFYFGGQLNEVFPDLGGSPTVGTAVAFSGRLIPFGLINGVGVAPSLQPIRGQGGFLQLGLPLSRIFNADPTGRHAGWSLYLTYGVDSVLARDARRTANGGANGFLRSDYGAIQLRYKLNKWVTFAHEETYIDSRTVSGVLKVFRGNPARTAHAWRSEFGTIFAF